MGITLFGIESKRFEQFGQWTTTPPYAAVASIGHPGPDPDLDSTGNDTRRSQWMPGKPQSHRFETVCGLVRDRGLRYLWPDSWVPDTESSGIASHELESWKSCYGRARWCLVLMPEFLYLQLHGQLYPDAGVLERPRGFYDPADLLGLLLASKIEFFNLGYGTVGQRPLPTLGRLISAIRGMNPTRLLTYPTNAISENATAVTDTVGGHNLVQKAMSSLVLVVFGDSAGSHRLNEHAGFCQTLQRNQMSITGNPDNPRLEASHIKPRKHLSAPNTQQCRKPAVAHFNAFRHHGQSRFPRMDLHGLDEASHDLQPWTKKQISAGPTNNTLGEGQHLYPKPEEQTLTKRSPTIQAQSQSANVSPLEQQARPARFVPMENMRRPANPMPSFLPLHGESMQLIKGNGVDNIRSWLDSTRLDQATQVGDVISDPSPLEKEVVMVDHHMEDSNDRASQTSMGTESQWLSFDEWAETTASLGPGHPLFVARNKIVQTALTKYVRQRQEQKGTRGQRTLVPPTSSQGRREIACPFYKMDPVKYSNCLRGPRLLTISQVKDHLFQQHRMPFYCPVCKKDFETARSRDRHIVKRVCNLREDFPHEGVSDDQRRLLLRRHRRLGLKQHWHKICDILQLGVSGSSSPYLMDTNNIANDVMGFRDFWRKNGQRCVADSLAAIDLSHWNRRNEERDLACLYAGILDGALESLIKSHKAKGSGCENDSRR